MDVDVQQEQRININF